MDVPALMGAAGPCHVSATHPHGCFGAGESRGSLPRVRSSRSRAVVEVEMARKGLLVVGTQRHGLCRELLGRLAHGASGGG